MNKKLFGLILIWIGIGVFTYPFIKTTAASRRAPMRQEAFEQEVAEIPDKVLEDLKADGEEYNKRFHADASGVVDPFSHESMDMVNPLKQFRKDDILGYINIPKIELTMPIYVGASKAHLDLGAATIDGTSLPFGGKNQRSVIAGHRGYYTFKGFLHVDELEPGDEILLTILDRDMTYIVSDMEVIEKYETDKLAVREGEDMVTLLTCHPYPKNNKRLLVNAVRKETAPSVSKETGADGNGEVDSVMEDYSERQPSTKVRRSNLLFLIVAIIGTVLWFLTGFKIIKTVRRGRADTGGRRR